MVTFLLTSAVAFVVGRHVVLHVLPKQEWWVRQDPKAFDDDPRAQGEYLERVLYSELSDESKLNLLFEVLGSRSSLNDQSQYPTDEADDNSRTLRYAAWKLERGAQKEQNGVGNRYPYLWEPFVDLQVAVLSNPAAKPNAQRKAMFLFNIAIELARKKYTWGAADVTGLPSKYGIAPSTRAEDDSGRAIQRATPHLVPFLTSPDVHLRRLATRAFACIGWNSPPGPLRSAVQVFPSAELIGCLTDADWRVRRNAALALSHVPRQDVPQAFPTLMTRFANETELEARLEVIQTLGQLDTTKDCDPRPAFADFLNSQRPETEHHGVSAYVYLALTRLDATTHETVQAAVARLNRRKPSDGGMDVTAAAVFLGGCSFSQAAGEALLTAIRAEWAEYRNGKWSRGYLDSSLFTFVYALLKHREVARTAVSVLIHLIPATHVGRYGFGVQTRIPPSTRYQQFPPRQPVLWGDDERIPEGWLAAELERLGPPAKSDLPALRALLDYDGEHITKPMVYQESAEAIAQVRQEAAKALLRDAVAGAKDRRAALEAVRDDSASHYELVAQAKAELKKLMEK